MANAPTSTSNSTSGTTQACPLAQKVTCHPKELKVKVTPKRRGDAPTAAKPDVTLTAGADSRKLTLLASPAQLKEPDSVELTATATNNRLASPLKKLLFDEAKAARLKEQLADGTIRKQTNSVRRAIQRGEKASELLATVRSNTSRWFDTEVIALLQNYDLVIETLASFPANTDSNHDTSTIKAINTVDIQVTGADEGTCSCQQHLQLKARAMTNTGGQVVQSTPFPLGYPKKKKIQMASTAQLPSYVEAQTNKVGSGGVSMPTPGADGYDLQEAAWEVGKPTFTLKDVHAAAIVDDVKQPQNILASLVKLLKLGFNFIHPMDLSFHLLSCGVKDRKTWNPQEFNALVRVYREITFAVGVKIPPFSKVTRESNQYREPKQYAGSGESRPDQRKDSLTTTDFAGFNKSEVKEYDPKSKFLGNPKTSKIEPVKTFQIYIKLNELEVNLTELAEKLEKLGELGSSAKSQASAGASQTAAYARFFKETKIIPYVGNHPVINPVFVMGLVLAARDIKVGWGKMQKLMDDFNAIMQKTPQLGFRFTWEMSFLDGLFEASLALGQGKNDKLPAEIKDRYVPTAWKFKLALCSTLFGVKWEGSFGIFVYFPVLGKLEIRVVGQIIGQVVLKLPEVEFAKGEETSITIGASGLVSGRLYAVAAVEGLLWTWKREIGIEAGFQIDKLLKWTSSKTEYSYRIWTLPVQWWFTAVNSRTGVEDSTMHVLYDSVLVLEDLFEHDNTKAH